MKHTISILIGLIFTITLSAQNQKSYLTSELVSGYPKEIEPIKNQFKLKDIRYSELETGIDSIRVFFGSMLKSDKKGYWVSLFTNNTLQIFSLVALKPIDSLNYLTKEIDINFNKSSNRISVKVLHQPLKNKVEYLWIDNNNISETAKITELEKPIQKGKDFPEIMIESIIGETITNADFANKFVVINWWATGCAPCREEIPGLNNIVEKYASNKNVLFIAITNDKKNRVENYLSKQEFKYKQTFVNEKLINIFGKSYPKNIIVNPNGIVTYFHEGANENTPKHIEQSLEAQLNK